MIQWLGLHTPNAGGSGSIRELDPTCHNQKKKKTPHAATKTWSSQINNFFFLKKGLTIGERLRIEGEESVRE